MSARGQLRQSHADAVLEALRDAYELKSLKLEASSLPSEKFANFVDLHPNIETLTFCFCVRQRLDTVKMIMREVKRMKKLKSITIDASRLELHTYEMIANLRNICNAFRFRNVVIKIFGVHY